MTKLYFAVFFICLANAGCASERLCVKVRDDKGAPVTNATVSVQFSSSHVVFSSGTTKKYNAKTDSTGNAVVKFNCTTSDIWWHVEADGYYRSETRKTYFKGENVLIPPVFGYWKLHEHEKKEEITLYPKKNPQPMYAHSGQKRVAAPIANGRYGFDLELFDWLPPTGKGKVADFYYVRQRKDEERVAKLIAEKKNRRIFVFRSDIGGVPQLGAIVGYIEFDKGCGVYIREQTGNENFPSTYEADLAAEYLSSIPIRICKNNGRLWLMEGPIITKNQYLVIRSRVKVDEKGNVISANYSKIIGPWQIGSFMGSYAAVFNPRPNDTNLEFDPERNLSQGKTGRVTVP